MMLKTNVESTQHIISKSALRKIEQIEAICGRDIGNGIEPLVKAAKGGLLGAARSIAEHPCPHVAIMTGFFIPHGTPPAAETDGPIGCAHLAVALQQAGVPVRLVTDSLCLNAVKVSALAAGLSPHTPFDVVPIEAKDGNDVSIATILDQWKNVASPVSHVIAIERAGPSSDGTVRNIHGNDITPYTAPLHQLFDLDNIISIGIGDLGNELGMATLSKELIARTIKLGEKIACDIPCNYPIVCGVSNWGAIGLVVALALLRKDWNPQLVKSLTLETDKHILKTLVYEGPAVDGDSSTQALTIETFPWDYHAEVIMEILTVAQLSS